MKILLPSKQKKDPECASVGCRNEAPYFNRCKSYGLYCVSCLEKMSEHWVEDCSLPVEEDKGRNGPEIED